MTDKELAAFKELWNKSIDKAVPAWNIPVGDLNQATDQFYSGLGWRKMALSGIGDIYVLRKK